MTTTTNVHVTFFCEYLEHICNFVPNLHLRVEK
jgi:hypothetical protein